MESESKEEITTLDENLISESNVEKEIMCQKNNSVKLSITNPATSKAEKLFFLPSCVCLIVLAYLL